MRTALVCWLSVLLVGIQQAANAEPPYLIRIPSNGGTNLFSLRGVSPDGSTAVGSAFVGGFQAYTWRQTDGFGFLGDLPGGSFQSEAWSSSRFGEVVAGVGYGEQGFEAFRWSAADGMVGLGDFPGGGFYSEARGVSADGSMIVGSGLSENGTEAFRWTESTGMVGIGALPGPRYFSRAYAVSADNLTIVGESASAETECGNNPYCSQAFRWTAAEGMVGIGELPGGLTDSRAAAVSAAASVIVGSSASALGTSEAFRWTSAGGMAGLGDLPGGAFLSEASAVSADGEIVIGRSAIGTQPISGNPIYRAFWWDAQNGMVNLASYLSSVVGMDIGSWRFLSATGISADGRTLVGFGEYEDCSVNCSYRPSYYMAHIPEPASLVTAALATSCCVVRRRCYSGPTHSA